MVQSQVATPVALFIFRRPATTRQVFEAIRQARPATLLLIADGPRPDVPDEAEACAAARAIVEKVDWPCQVLTDYAATNLGCKQRVSSGLAWVFSTVDQAIILEDDCVPHPSFFRFCEELLARYHDDQRVMAVSGDNFQFGRKRSQYSYYFSHYFHCWGWATWRRAWQYYDPDMQFWPEVRAAGLLHHILGDHRAVRYWTRIFDKTYAGRIDTWDYQWLFSSWLQGAYTIIPEVNLVSNIGFGDGATHTTSGSKLANIPAEPIAFPLRHPAYVVRHAEADRYTQDKVIEGTLLEKVRAGLSRLRSRLRAQHKPPACHTHGIHEAKEPFL